MKGLWNRLRNGKALWSAYRNVSTLTGDDLANETIFTHLREFAAAPTGPVSLPAGLIREFNASQKRARGRKKFRFGVGALFATIVLFPSLAYAGALPTSVARVVQRIFNVVSVPIQIPSVATQSGQSDERGQTAPTSVQHGSDSESQTPGAEATETPSQETSSKTSETGNSSSEPESTSSNTLSTEIKTQITTPDGVSGPSGSSDEGDLVRGDLVQGDLVQGTVSGSVGVDTSGSD